jgi:hypothetical protein
VSLVELAGKIEDCPYGASLVDTFVSRKREQWWCLSR